jgi:hypothetical protein
MVKTLIGRTNQSIVKLCILAAAEKPMDGEMLRAYLIS